MTKSLATAWVKALRSGKFKQGYGELLTKRLNENKEYCCLGVLATVCRARKAFETLDLSDKKLDGAGTLTHIGLDNAVGLPTGVEPFLASKNDGQQGSFGLSTTKWGFKRIATWIEKKFVNPTPKKKAKK